MIAMYDGRSFAHCIPSLVPIAVLALVLVTRHDLTPATVFLALTLASVLLATAFLALAAFLSVAFVATGKPFFPAFVLKCHVVASCLRRPISAVESANCIPRKVHGVVPTECLFYSCIIGSVA
jgi:hypothetical protein